MGNKKDKELNRKYYEEYFKEDLDAIEEELKKSKEYSEIIDNEIKKFSGVQSFTKGSERYLIEHITNAVQLQTQRQGLRKDRVAIKKFIMDYTNKELDKEGNAESKESILEEIKKIIDKDLNESEQPDDRDNLDKKIDERLENEEEDQ